MEFKECLHSERVVFGKSLVHGAALCVARSAEQVLAVGHPRMGAQVSAQSEGQLQGNVGMAPRGLGQADGGEGIPRGEDLVVQARLDTSVWSVAPGLELAKHVFQVAWIHVGLGLAPKHMLASFPEAVVVQPKRRVHTSHLVWGQKGFQFRGSPQVVGAFLAFAVGVERGTESAMVQPPIPFHECHGLGQSLDELRMRLVRPRRKGRHHLGVVVEHLLKMRDVPSLVDAVARKPSSDVVVDAASNHSVQSAKCMCSCGPLSFRTQAFRTRCTSQEFKLAGQRELGRTHPASMLEVPGLGPAVERLQERRCLRLRRRLAHGFHCRGQFRGVASHAVGVFGFDVDDGLEGGEPLGFGQIHASPYGPPVRQGNAIQRPPPLTGHQLDGLHVNLVHVGTFFAVDLDAHEMGVHEMGRLGVGKSLVLHHVAPMACAVPHADQHQFAFGPGFGPSFRPVWQPTHGIVHVLTQVGGGLCGEGVWW